MYPFLEITAKVIVSVVIISIILVVAWIAGQVFGDNSEEDDDG